MTTQVQTQLRPQLGDYVSIICFRYMRHMAEDTAGRALIIAAGRKRGHDLIAEIGLTGASSDPAQIQQALAQGLGLEGTRLCLVERVEAFDDGFQVWVDESVCSMGVEARSPICVYTLGAVMGAVEAMSGKRLVGKEVECVAMGADKCLFVFHPIG